MLPEFSRSDARKVDGECQRDPDSVWALACRVYEFEGLTCPTVLVDDPLVERSTPVDVSPGPAGPPSLASELLPPPAPSPPSASAIGDSIAKDVADSRAIMVDLRICPLRHRAPDVSTCGNAGCSVLVRHPLRERLQKSGTIPALGHLRLA
jgi:hypothetical protein